ncbi:MAG TPA: hypothetical protein VHE35_27880 [Kofleriaceae bacterium]|nr:hypothetical protein [Kofleriaceae bacterium]
MRASALLRLPDGREVEVGPGDLIGRTPSAAAVIDDPRVSEAHAFVSLRHGELHLLSLRRLLVIGGKAVNHAVLRPGLVVVIADELRLTVVEVVTPSEVLGIHACGQPVRLLSQVASVVGVPPRVVGKVELDAHAQLWSIGLAWRMRLRDRDAVELHAGDSFEVAGVRFTLVPVPIGQAGATATATASGGAVVESIRIVAFYDTVQLHRRNREVVTVGGTGARILSELIACQGPTGWEILARAVWPDSPDLAALRHRWDVALGRLRARLREEGVRELLRADGAGQLALELCDGDEVDDRT